MEKKLLELDVSEKKFEVRTVDDDGVIGVADYAVKVIDPLCPDCMLIGAGPFAGSRLPGVNRLTVAGVSPLTEAFHVSAIGGAGYFLSKTGVDFLVIRRKSDMDGFVVPIIKNIDGSLNVEFYEISENELMDIYYDEGAFSLQSHLLERCGAEFTVGDDHLPMRILAVGPAALTTNMGAILTTLIRRGKFLSNADGLAGRGGMGSLLAQTFKIVGIVYGGNYERKFPIDLTDKSVTNEIFQKLFDDGMVNVAKDATKKYKLGTLLANYENSTADLPMFNFNYHIPSEDRERLYGFLIDNLLKPFAENVVHRTCGEPSCPTPCKKVNNDSKLDYEPSNALGPNSGIFTLEDIRKVMKKADVYGIDGIELGNMTATVFEWVHRGMLSEEEIGINTAVNFDPQTYTLDDSKKNTQFCLKLIEDLTYGTTEFAKQLNKGIRAACKEMDAKHRAGKNGAKFCDFAYYTPLGTGNGCIAPIRYRVPGAIIVPGVVPGKFHTDYSYTYYLPEELGKVSADRTIWEISAENLVFCRFHRKWYEKNIEKVYNDVFSANVNIYEHHRKLLQKIIKFNEKTKATPMPPETKLSKDAIKTYITDHNVGDLENWAEKLRKEGDKAVEEYWNRAQKSFNDLIME